MTDEDLVDLVGEFEYRDSFYKIWNAIAVWERAPVGKEAWMASERVKDEILNLVELALEAPERGNGMKCYGQLWYESGSYANPQADQYEEYDSIEEAKYALASTWNDIDVDPKGGQGVTLLLWLGKVDPEWLYPCDGEPDRVYELGPKGGVRRVM